MKTGTRRVVLESDITSSVSTIEVCHRGSRMLRHSFVVMLILVVSPSIVAAQARPYRARVSENVMQKMLVHSVKPQCPQDGVRLEGQVVLKAVIDKAGNIESLKVVTGHPLLVPRAIDAVKQWTYKPFLINGNPVFVETTIRVQLKCPSGSTTGGVVGDRADAISYGQ